MPRSGFPAGSAPPAVQRFGAHFRPPRSRSRFFRRTDASPALCGKHLRTSSFRPPRSRSRLFRRTDASPALGGKHLRTSSFRPPRSRSRLFRRTDASPALCGKRLRTFSFRVPDPGLAFSAAPTRAPHSAGSICEPPPSARLRSSRFRTIYSQPPFPPPDGIVSAPVRPRGISPPDCRAGGGYSPRSSAAFDPPGFRAFRQNAEKRLLPPASPRRSAPPRVSPPGEMQKKVAFAPDLFVPLPLG